MDHIVETNKMVTAVEWLLEQLENVDYNPLEKGGYDTAKKRIIEQAKAMEKEQMLGFYLDRIYAHKELREEFEQYYKETYNK